MATYDVAIVCNSPSYITTFYNVILPADLLPYCKKHQYSKQDSYIEVYKQGLIFQFQYLDVYNYEVSFKELNILYPKTWNIMGVDPDIHNELKKHKLCLMGPSEIASFRYIHGYAFSYKYAGLYRLFRSTTDTHTLFCLNYSYIMCTVRTQKPILSSNPEL